jgi:hypothetical protein
MPHAPVTVVRHVIHYIENLADFSSRMLIEAASILPFTAAASPAFNAKFSIWARIADCSPFIGFPIA